MATVTSITEEQNNEQEYRPLAEDVVVNMNRQNQPENQSSSEGEPFIPEAETYWEKENQERDEDEKIKSSNGGSKVPPKQDYFNQDFGDLPEDEKNEGAEQTAELAINMYAGLKMSIPKLVGVSDRTLKKLEQKGEINLSVPIPKSPNNPQTTTIASVIRNFNESIKPAFQTSEDFKRNVRPLLTSIFKKKGVALSPEHQLMIYVGQDLISTGLTVARCMSDRREIINELKNVSAAYGKKFTPSPTETTNTAKSEYRGEPEESPSVSVSENFEAVATDIANKRQEKADSMEELSKKVVERADRKSKQESDNQAYAKVKSKRGRKPKEVIN